MPPIPTPHRSVVNRLQELIRVNFAGRDELHAAAELIHDEPVAAVCQRLSDHLGGRAAELQQWLLICGRKPVEPTARVPAVRRAATRRSRVPVQERLLAQVAQQAHHVREVYDRAIRLTPDRQVSDILRRHQEDAEFGENVLVSIGAVHSSQKTDATAESRPKETQRARSADRRRSGDPQAASTSAPCQ